MASSSNGEGSLSDAFKKFATKADGKEATTKDITRWCQDAGVFKGSKTCNSNNLDIAFSAVKTKGKNTITLSQVEALIAKISTAYGKDHKIPETEARTKLTNLLAGGEKTGHGTTKTSATGNVAKMTDTTQYTGAHKSRFGEDGKGKGLEGREDVVDNSGYVGNYKGAGTFDSK